MPPLSACVYSNMRFTVILSVPFEEALRLKPFKLRVRVVCGHFGEDMAAVRQNPADSAWLSQIVAMYPLMRSRYELKNLAMKIGILEAV